MEWVPVISIGCAVLTAVCTAWNVFDKISERKPLARVAGGRIWVSNPQKKALFIRRILFTGEPVSALGENTDSYGARVYEPIANYIAPVDEIVLASEAKSIIWNFRLSDEHVYRASLKRRYRFRWDEFDVVVYVSEIEKSQ